MGSVFDRVIKSAVFAFCIKSILYYLQALSYFQNIDRIKIYESQPRMDTEAR